MSHDDTIKKQTFLQNIKTTSPYESNKYLGVNITMIGFWEKEFERQMRISNEFGKLLNNRI